MANIVTSLPDYVKQNENELLYKTIFGSASVERFSKQLGVKGKAAINLLSTTPVFQDADSCGFDASGDATFTQRNIETGLIKVNMEFCHRTLIGKYTEHEVKVAANQDTMPFEEEITASIVDGIKAQMEEAVWQGDTSSTDATLKHFNGILKVLGSSAVAVTLADTDSAYDNIKKVFAAIPRAARRKAGLKINVAPELYDAFIMDMVAANLYHYAGPQNANPMEFVLPGTNVAVVSTDGLAGTKKIVAAVDSNIYFGTDMLGDEEEFKLWFSDDDDTFKFKAVWNAGVQVAFPDEVVVGTIA